MGGMGLGEDVSARAGGLGSCLQRAAARTHAEKHDGKCVVDAPPCDHVRDHAQGHAAALTHADTRCTSAALATGKYMVMLRADSLPPHPANAAANSTASA